MAGCFFIKTIFPIAMCTIQEYPLGSAIIRKGAGDYMDKKDMTSLNKYDFNAYDTVIALTLTQYLKTLPQPKTVLRGIIDPKIIRVDTGSRTAEPLKTDVDGEALAELLDAAVAWAKQGMPPKTIDPLEVDLLTGLAAVTEGFDGRAYVQSMEAGLAEFLWDLYRS